MGTRIRPVRLAKSCQDNDENAAVISERENTLRAIEYRYPEWIPVHFDLMASVVFRYGMKLAEMMSRHPLLFAAARIEATAATVPPSEPFHERRFIDGWGCEWQEVQAGILGQVVGHPLADWDKLGLFTVPDPARQWDWESIRLRCRQERARGELVNGYMGIVEGGFFDRLQFLRGLDNLLVDLVEHPPELDRLIALVLEDRFAAISCVRYCGEDGHPPGFADVAHILGCHNHWTLPVSHFLWGNIAAINSQGGA